jgi:hypothetical protein
MKSENSIINHDSQNLVAEIHADNIKSSSTEPVFLLCDKCINVLHILESQETDR